MDIIEQIESALHYGMKMEEIQYYLDRDDLEEMIMKLEEQEQ